MRALQAVNVLLDASASSRSAACALQALCKRIRKPLRWMYSERSSGSRPDATVTRHTISYRHLQAPEDEGFHQGLYRVLC